MGEEILPFGTEFNGSIRIEARGEKLTSEAGALALREVMTRFGIDRLLGRLRDPRKKELITHPLSELVRTMVLLFAQGWRDEDDADAHRDDPSLRLAVSDRRGVSPLESRPDEDRKRNHNPSEPDGLPSQPTLSRLLGTILSAPKNLSVLRSVLFAIVVGRMRAKRGTAARQRMLTIDVDSLPIEVHGHQPGSEHNGHYHARIYHPIVASIGEEGDLLDVKLRPGNAHTAEGGLAFILPLLKRVEKQMCQVAALRIDAGFPEEKLLAALEKRGTPYVARVRNNATLDKLAEPHLRRPPGPRPKELREWTYELDYQAASWSRQRRVVLVVQERPEELYLHHFWIITSWGIEQIAGEQLLELYRKRGTAESHLGELMDVLDPALSSAPRTKAHYRGAEPRTRTATIDAFAANAARLLLNAIAYNLLHVLRTLVADATGEGWSLRRLRERVLRIAARILVHARRAVVVIGRESAARWRQLWQRLRRLRLPAT